MNKGYEKKELLKVGMHSVIFASIISALTNIGSNNDAMIISIILCVVLILAYRRTFKKKKK